MTVLRNAALAIVLAGAAGAVGLTLYAGRHNTSRLLMLIFAIWVLSPFVALVWAYAVSVRWSPSTRATLYGVMLLTAIATLAIYACVALGPPRPKTAPMFVIVPPVSWLLLATAVPIAARLSRSRSRRRAGV